MCGSTQKSSNVIKHIQRWSWIAIAWYIAIGDASGSNLVPAIRNEMWPCLTGRRFKGTRYKKLLQGCSKVSDQNTEYYLTVFLPLEGFSIAVRS